MSTKPDDTHQRAQKAPRQPNHSHFTSDVKPPGICARCDWDREHQPQDAA